MGGQTLVQRVYRGAVESGILDQVIVATDDERILDHVLAFGGEAMMTSADHPTGTDRVAEVAATVPEATIVVNIQGDEPFLQPAQIQSVIDPFLDSEVEIITLATPIKDEQSLLSPNVVKVVRTEAGRALYFSRHAIPFLRDVPIGRWIDQGRHLQHVGLYAYRASILQALTNLPPAPLELDESLEQLRWLQAGYRIYVGLSDGVSFGIDTPADLEEAIKRIVAQEK